jgi:hypothetical protein
LAPNADELAVSVTSVTLGLQGDVLISDRRLLADVGLHALARRYERGTDRHDTAVLSDLALLAHAHESAVALGSAFTIAGWRGEVCLVAGAPVLCVRTFVA